jgi:hypothetical protein
VRLSEPASGIAGAYHAVVEHRPLLNARKPLVRGIISPHRPLELLHSL